MNLTQWTQCAPKLTYCSKCGRCAGRNPPSVLGGIQLYGLPAPPAGGTRRLFALSPRGSAVSTLPPGVLAPDRGSQHLPGEVPFLSGADALAPRLAASRPCLVDGVSSDPCGPGGRSPAHRPRDKGETGSISLPDAPHWLQPQGSLICLPPSRMFWPKRSLFASK